MARQFQGYARGRGFSSRSPGSGAVSRIQEQGNKTISGLRRQLQSKRQQDQQYIAELDANFRRGEQIKDEIKSFEDKAFNLKMANIKQNQNQHLENIQREAAKEAETFKQLSQFSKTLSEGAINVGTAIENAKAEAASTVTKLSGANRSTYADQAAADELEKNSIANENRMAKVVVRDGMPEAQRQATRAFDPNRKFKDKKAAVAEAWNRYSAEATYNNYGPALAHKIFKELGLLDARDRLFTEFADKYEKLNLAYKTQNNRARAVSQSNELDTKAAAQFFNNPTPETLGHAWQTFKSGTEDGKGPRNNKLANDYAFEKLLTSTNLSDQQVLDLLQNTHLRDEDGNKLEDTFYSRFEKNRVQKLLQDRRDAIVKEVGNQKKAVDAENTDNFLKVNAELDKQAEQGPVDFDSFKMEIMDVSMSTEQRNKTLEKLYEMSIQRFQNKPLLAEIDRLRSNGQDYTDVAKQLKGRDRYKYLNLASQEIQAKKEAGIDDSVTKSQIKAALIKALGQQNIGADKDPSLVPAVEDAMIDIGRDTVNNPQGADTRAGAHKLAVEVKLQEIKAGIGKYEVKGMGRGNDNQTSNYFPYYSPNGKYFTTVVRQNPSQLMSSVRNRPDIRKDTFLTTQESLTSIYNSIKNNEPYQLEYGLQRINKAYPDTLQLQLNKFAIQNGLPTITVPLTQNQFLAARENDPRVKQFAQKMDTIQEEILFPVIADPSARSDPRYRSDAVNQRLSFMEVAPAEGGITGLTVQDYQELAYAVSAEAQRGTDDEFAVAASILNRLASGKYGKTVAEVIRAPGQYEGVYNGMARYEPQLAQRLASPEGQRMIVAMLQKLQGRTDFKGQSQIGNRDASDPMFSDRGNFYHYSGQSAGGGAYQGPIDTSYERFIN